jgi:CubicO group peptidase (beta-lactamase class C family)
VKRAFVGIGLVLAVMMGGWVALQGPVTVFRIIVYGDSSIQDHARFPFRPLTPSPQPYRLPAVPQPGLERVTATPLGTLDLADFLERSGTIAFIVVKDDRLLFERYFHGHGPERISQTFSVSKSILSALIGAAIDDGLIGSADDAVTRYVPELAGAGFGHVRLVELLQMNSGMDYIEDDNPIGRHARFYYTPHLKAEILNLRLKPARDASFTYKSGENALLGLVLERALQGRTITQYTQERLWNPLGMEYAARWSLDHEAGLERTWCCLSTTARDLAKFGMLYRDGGLWMGRTILSRSWVEQSTRSGPYSPQQWQRATYAAGFWNYGYQWWLVDRSRGDFAARGKDGQFVYVAPARGVVIVRLGDALGEHQGRSLDAAAWIALFQAVADRAASVDTMRSP